MNVQLDKDREDAEKVAYILLHRARMHPIDLRRQLDTLTSKAYFTMEDTFPSPRYRFEILMQVAIEWLLDGDDVQTQIAGNPYSRQVVYDALYYASRLWEDASNAEAKRLPGFKNFKRTEDENKPGLELNENFFSEYIESRSAPEEEQPKPPSEVAQPEDPNPKPIQHKRISGTDFDFLFIKVRELLNFLCEPEKLVAEINSSPRPAKPPAFILNEIPMDPSLRLMIQEKGKLNYRWLYDASGRYLHTRDVESINEDVRPAITYIREVITALDELGVNGGLQTVARAKIIPRPADLRIVTPALDRLDRLGAEETPYGRMGSDRDAVVEFARTLDAFEPNLKAALLSAGVFAPEVKISSPSPSTSGSPDQSLVFAKFSEALVRVCQHLQLNASPEEDLRRLIVLLSSCPSISDVTSEDELETVVKFAGGLAKRPRATDEEAETIVKAAWDNAKLRFSQRYQDPAVRIDLQFEDLFTALRGVGPGHELSTDFANLTARAWSLILLRSLSADPLPPWLRIPALLELGLIETAERLWQTVPGEESLISGWVQAAKQRSLDSPVRKNTLVLAVDQRSLTENWKPSPRYGALVLTVGEFSSLSESLKKQGLLKPLDYPLDLLSVELVGNPTTLGRMVAMKPQDAITAMTTRSPSKDLEPFLNLPLMNYFGPERPLMPPGGTSTSVPFVINPKELDNIIDASIGSQLQPPV